MAVPKDQISCKLHESKILIWNVLQKPRPQAGTVVCPMHIMYIMHMWKSDMYMG